MAAVKILTVDDSKTIRMIVTKAFRPYDCDVMEASNGVEGLSAASRVKPTLIILDLTMPVMDGVEMLSKLKTDPALKTIPVIMLTAEAGKENVLKIAKMGIRDYLIKPFKEEQLIEKVGRVIPLQFRAAGKNAVKTLSDSAVILVLEDKPAIIQTITDAVASTPWKVIGKSTVAEAIDEISLGIPDVMFVSLTLADDGGFNFFQEIRMRPNTRGIPIFGMCIKTDSDRSSRAEQMGFNGIITKPIDIEILKSKLVKAMNVDISSKYFSMEDDIQYLIVPAKVVTQTITEIEHYLKPKVEDMVNAGMTKFIMDMTEVTKVDISVVKMVLNIMKKCQDLGIRFRLVGSSTVSTEMKAFTEAAEIVIDPTVDEAKALLNSQATA
jgi:two-component system cell cycle response regulator